jgi:hypothetical protein
MDKVKKHEIQIVLAESSSSYRIVRAFGLGEDASFAEYQRQVDSLQGEFDDSSEPVRVYVIEDGVPVYAGGQNARRNGGVRNGRHF